MKKLLLFLTLLIGITFTVSAKYDLFPRISIGDVAKPEDGAIFSVQSTTGSSVPCPKMTEVQRDALADLGAGFCIFNTTAASTQFYNGSTWLNAGSGAVLSEWSTGTVYGVGNFVYTTPDYKLWAANTAHTAGATFAGDLANWDELSSGMAAIGSSTDNGIARWDGTSGNAIQDSSVLIDDSDNVSGIVNLTATGTTTLATSLTGVAKLTSGVVSASNVDLTSEVTGTLPIANGGTGSTSTTYVDLTTNVTGTLPIANGGTGSATQNFVDLTTAQSVAGVKTFSALPVFSAGVDINSNATVNATGAGDALAVDHNGSGDALTINQSGSGEALIITGGQVTTNEDILMSGTGQIDIPVGTTAQRSGSPNSGMLRYNTSLGGFEGYDGSTWSTFSTSSLPTLQIFTSGSGTYTTPAGVSYIKVRLVGGGGGGSGGGSSPTTGGIGTSTTFGTLTGAAGTSAGQGAGEVLGGTATIGAGFTGVAQRGASGGGIKNSTSTQSAQGGHGGNSPFGGSGGGSWSTASATSALANSGSGGGGGGCSTTNITGQGGSSGGYIEAFNFSPAASYSYSVGTGGVAGGGGGGGGSGGTGGSGIIIVEEYYP